MEQSACSPVKPWTNMCQVFRSCMVRGGNDLLGRLEHCDPFLLEES